MTRPVSDDVVDRIIDAIVDVADVIDLNRAEAREAVRAAIASLDTEMEWRPISEAPDKEIAALLLFPPSEDDAEFFGGRIDIGNFEPCPTPETCCAGNWDWPWDERGREPGPTHWMPLPKPPAALQTPQSET